MKKINLMNSSSKEPRHLGFDAAVRRREDDFLNRWPLAKEIYGIAITGPQDWSVRVGIYGEWGTGKTSVLEFISEMAKQDGQILVRFNPWEHSTKDSLWRSFVLTVFKEPALAKRP
jgi:predicted KAP-like P-loop ATPase